MGSRVVHDPGDDDLVPGDDLGAVEIIGQRFCVDDGCRLGVAGAVDDLGVAYCGLFAPVVSCRGTF